MRKLFIGQLDRASEVFGNIAVAWFSLGVISPVLFRPQTIFNLFFTLGISLVMAAVFFVISLGLAKEVKL